MTARKKRIGRLPKYYMRKLSERRRQTRERLECRKRALDLDHTYATKFTNWTLNGPNCSQAGQLNQKTNINANLKKSTMNASGNIVCNQKDQLMQETKDPTEASPDAVDNERDQLIEENCDLIEASVDITCSERYEPSEETNDPLEASVDIACHQSDHLIQETHDLFEASADTACNQRDQLIQETSNPGEASVDVVCCNRRDQMIQVSLGNDFLIQEDKNKALGELLSSTTFPNRWIFPRFCRPNISICQLSDGDDPVVQKTIIIDQSWDVVLKVHRHIIPKSHAIWNFITLPLDGTTEEVAFKIFNFVKTINSYNVCCGSSEEKLLNMYSSLANQNQLKEECNLESSFHEKLSDSNSVIESTLRSKFCWFLVKHFRCRPCSDIRKRLQKMNFDKLHDPTSIPKTLQYKHMQQDQLISCLRKRKKECLNLKAQIQRLKEKLKNKSDGIFNECN